MRMPARPREVAWWCYQSLIKASCITAEFLQRAAIWPQEYRQAQAGWRLKEIRNVCGWGFLGVWQGNSISPIQVIIVVVFLLSTCRPYCYQVSGTTCRYLYCCYRYSLSCRYFLVLTITSLFRLVIVVLLFIVICSRAMFLTHHCCYLLRRFPKGFNLSRSYGNKSH